MKQLCCQLHHDWAVCAHCGGEICKECWKLYGKVCGAKGRAPAHLNHCKECFEKCEGKKADPVEDKAYDLMCHTSEKI